MQGTRNADEEWNDPIGSVLSPLTNRKITGPVLTWNNADGFKRLHCTVLARRGWDYPGQETVPQDLYA